MSAIVISLDAELAWGFHDLDSPPKSRINNARTGWRRTLELLNEFEIPATWAVVGHLLLDRCDGKHENHPAPKGWFNRDPGGNARDQRDWFADGLVTALLDSPVPHEIACHSFSHMEFGSESVTAEMAEAELRASRAASDARSIPLYSFIFPRNNIGHQGLLAKHGFRCYRGGRTPWWYDRNSIPRRVGKLWSLTKGTGHPPLSEPTVDENGLVVIPYSLYLFEFEGVPRRVTEWKFEKPVLRKAKKGVDAAVADDGVFHVWFHPNNLTSEADGERVRELLRYIDEKRRSDGLEVKTMEQIAEEVKR